ncbi:MAG: phospholipid carrier-dependent glycosyltransferase [Defluviitaleaceae bacterium]|nr:phospholipid carrier-dependent glycosyltransferase [Defluviitaleaceae bacterium]
MLGFLVVLASLVFIFAQLQIWSFWRSEFYQRHKKWLVCGIITAVYAAFAFVNLGDFRSPQSSFFGEMGENSAVVVDFGQIQPVEYIQFMTGASYEQVFLLEFSYDGEFWGGDFFIETGRAFAWDIRQLIVQTQFIRITPISDDLRISEMGFRTAVDTFISVAAVSENGAALFDEQDLLPLQALDYMHSSYFDEIYYPKTAYQLIHGLPIYEWTHPPLGKVIIAWGIEIFGMTPFGWRFMGTLAGVVMLVPFYLLAWEIFKGEKGEFWAGFCTFIFAFDFMHYVQTRVGAIDSFVILFILAMFYFMYKYSRLDFENLPLWKTFVPLLFSGIFMGLAVATKWFGLYGAAGIAVIFFVIVGRNAVRHRRSEDFENFRKFSEKIIATFAVCLGFFVVIPAAIYVLSYIPYGGVSSVYSGGFWEVFWLNQADMLDFHLYAMIGVEHRFASPWWEWLINWRPMLYYDVTLPSGLRQGISAFGNPIVWWAGLPALIYVIYRVFVGFLKGKNSENFVPMFLVVGYFAFLVPWFFAGRVTFIYYYFANAAFLALMIGFAVRENSESSRGRIAAWVFAGVAFGLFLLFYPVITGIPVGLEFVLRFLRWGFMREWVLVVE